jgi:drug/metabolite transporter (DMT)-like permease
MSASPSNLRGIAAMICSTGFFVVNDTFMKVAMAELPPFEVLFLRGIGATIICGAVVLALGQWRGIAGAFNCHVLGRGVGETASVLCYVVALANMPIADVIAICQTAPLLLIVAVALIWREPIGPMRLVLIGTGFLGAVLVAQPSASGVSSYVLLAFATAGLIAFRDVVARGVPAQVPAFLVTLATNAVVTIGSGAMMLLTEGWVAPRPVHLATLAFAALLVTLGHLTIFLAYRLGAAAAVAPFFYSFTIWAVAAGFLVWGEIPNPLAITGIVTIVASGLGVVLLDQRRARRLPAASLVERT